MIRAVVTDIEGTTSSLSFVKDVLFPYSRSRMAAFIASRQDDPAVRRHLDDARTEAGGNPDDAALVAQLLRWIDEDKKITPLKALQGLIWEAGYEKGELVGHMYDDAVQALRRWHAQGIRLYVYSSGSVRAQQLIFGYTQYGDLTPLFSGYFDTNVGHKRERSAYEKIVRDIALPPAEILFLSDIQEELDAASAAGMQAIQLVRHGELPQSGHRVVRSFDEIDLGRL